MQHLGPLKAEQSLGTPALHKQPGQGMEPIKISGGQMGQLAPLRTSGGNTGQVGFFLSLVPLLLYEWPPSGMDITVLPS